MGIINAEVTLQELGEKQRKAVSDQKKIPLSAMFLTVTSNVRLRKGIKNSGI